LSIGLEEIALGNVRSGFGNQGPKFAHGPIDGDRVRPRENDVGLVTRNPWIGWLDRDQHEE